MRWFSWWDELFKRDRFLFWSIEHDLRRMSSQEMRDAAVESLYRELMIRRKREAFARIWREMKPTKV